MSHSHDDPKSHASHEGHDHAAGHGHSHEAGGHVHGPASFGRAFAIGVALNAALVVAEAVFGYLSNSTALLADAGHNLSDIFGLIVAWAASIASQRAPQGRYTYGFRGSSILAALFNAIFLLVATGAIGWESVLRFAKPEPVESIPVMVVASIGIAINFATAMLFARGRTGDINIRGAFLHMMADAAVSAGVVVSAALIMATGWLWLDPLASLVICGVILWSTTDLLKSSVAMAMGAASAGVDLGAVRATLLKRPGVEGVHDLHVWPISTTETAMTCHLVMPSGCPGDAFLMETAQLMTERHAIGHSTMQVERSSTNGCAQAPDNVV